MKSTPLLEMLYRIAPRLHIDEVEGGLNVVAVGIQDVPNYRQLFEAFTTIENGVFVRADVERLYGRGPVQESLKAHLEQQPFLTYEDQSGNINLEIVEIDKGFEVQINGQVPPSEGAQQTLVSILNAIFELAGHLQPDQTIACLVYKDAGFDDKLKERVWRFLTRDLIQVGLGRLQHLILILESDYIGVSPYCESQPAISYIVQGNNLRRRRTYDAGIQLTHEIAQRARSQPLVLFLGAGFSFSSGLPLGNALRDWSISHQLPYSLSDLPSAYHRWLVRNREVTDRERDMNVLQAAAQLTLERVMVEELRASGGRENSATLKHFAKMNEDAKQHPGQALLRLRDMLASDHRKLILVTVNFDTLLESVAGQYVQVFADNQEFAEAAQYIPEYFRDGGPVPYLKLHGTIDRLGTVLADLRSITAGVSDEMEAALDSIVPVQAADSSTQPVPWTYVGCSMRDKDLEVYLKQASFVRRVEEYWVGPFIDQTIQDFADVPRGSLWLDRRHRELEQRCITETADAFLSELSRLWLA